MMRMELLAALACLLATGCSGALPATVSGRVTLDGQPLPPSSGFVSFSPVSGTGRQPNSPLRPDGTYSLASGDEQGVVPGEYLVCVTATELPDPTSTAPPTAPRLLTPAKYADKKTTPLKFTIHSGHNTIDLPLTK